MPTIHREGGFRFVIFTDDHEPARVHVWKGGGWVVVQIRESPVRVREAHGMKPGDVRRAVRIVEENRTRYLIRWREIHG